MISKLIENLKGKRILILGFGIEGQSTYQFIRNHLPKAPLTIADKDPKLEEHVFTTAKDNYLTIVTGENYASNIHQFDLVIKSPGVLLSPENRVPSVTSQAEIILKHFRDQVVGVTGTKGKSTTASLLYHIFQLAGRKVALVGNIGIPPLDLVDEWDEEVTVIFEMSSHQLDQLEVSPHVAILLNLYQEHLDHYVSYEAYQKAKLRIFMFQCENDFHIYNQDDGTIAQHLMNRRPASKGYGFSLKHRYQPGCSLSHNLSVRYTDGGDRSTFKTEKLQLQGDHNLMNIMAAICACKIQHLPDASIQSGLDTFRGLPHRLEYIGQFAGIHFYNDSIATIPEATMHAVRTLQKVDTLILGGYDRGIEYQGLIGFLSASPVRNFVFIGNAGERMMELMQKNPSDDKRLLFAAGLKEAFQYIVKYTCKDTICLLSPAAASYGMFKDFKERGDTFRNLAMNL